MDQAVLAVDDANSLASMRTLIVVPSLVRAGAETQAVDLANGLSSMGREVQFCSFERRLDQRARLSDKIPFHHILRRRKYDFSLVSALAKTIDRERIDVVLGVQPFVTLIASLASGLSISKPPVVAAIHTTINRGLKQELQDRLLYRHMLKRRPAIVFVCENQRKHWVCKYPELEPVARVVHNGIEPARFQREDHLEAAFRLRSDLRIPNDAFVFACIAGFRPEKGHDLLVRAFGRVADHAFLVLAGDGERLSSVKTLVSRAGISGRVRFLGNVPDVRPVVVASNVTVLASTAVETFSMAMLESMALGVPVIAPRIGGLPEAITPGETGLLFPIGDSDEMYRCMQIMVADPIVTTTMGRLARQKVTERFTFDIMLKHYEEILVGAASGAIPTC